MLQSEVAKCTCICSFECVLLHCNLLSFDSIATGAVIDSAYVSLVLRLIINNVRLVICFIVLIRLLQAGNKQVV